MKLFYREYGRGEPLIILHGLFGSADNWMTQAKMLSEHYHVYVVDQRNHGLSPHDAAHDYLAMADDLNEFFVQHNLDKAIVLGHSMGGKTAMNFAIKYPSRVSKLIVVDIIPKAYPVHHDKILVGLKSLDIKNLTSRNQADEQLARYVDEPGVRQFLLKNLSRESTGGFSWRMNLDAIDQNIEEMGEQLVVEGRFEGPVLFIVGMRSNYFSFGDEKLIRLYFPNYQLVEMETGHWIQAEKPKEFVDVVLKFLRG
jgi:pimeloyl-ACP methyl ester carboxylesterase